MIIRQLELKNFLSHEHSLINFDKGVTVIYGHNGAGKSSIIDALKFALFGDKRGGNIADLIRRGAREMEVNLDFEIGQDEFRISRIMEMGKSGVKTRDATLTKNKSVLSTTVRSVDDTVSGILGIDKEAFLNSVFVEQGDIDSLISKARSDRERTFSRILGLDLLEKYSEDLGKLSRDTESRLLTFSNVTENMEQVESAINEKEELLVSVRNEISQVETELKSTSGILKNVEKERNELQETLAQLRSISSTVESRKNILGQIKQRVGSRTGQIQDIKEKITNLTGEIDSDLLNKADLIADYFSTADTLPPREELLKGITESIGKLDKMRNDLKSLEQGYKTYSELDIKLKDIRQKRTEMEQSDSRFKAAEKRLMEIEADLTRRRDALQSIGSKFSEKLGVSEFTGESIQKLKQDFNLQRDDFNSKIQEIKSNVGRFNTDLGEIDANRNRLETSSECPLCLQELTEDHRSRIHQEYSEKENKLRKSLSDLAAAKKKLDEKNFLLSSKLEFLNSAEVNDGMLNLQFIASLENEKKNLEAVIRETKSDQDLISRYKEQITDAEKRMNALSNTYNTYRSYELALSTSNVEEQKTRLSGLENEITQSRAKLLDLDKKIGFQPEEEIRNRIRIMKDKEKSIRDIRENLLSLEATQKSDLEKLDEFIKEIEEQSKKLSDLPEMEKRHSEISTRYEEVNRSLHVIIGRESSLKTRFQSEEKGLIDLREGMARLKAELQTMEKMKKSIDMIKKLRSCFDRDGIQKAIRKDSAVYITNKVREYSTSFNLDFDDVKINEEMAIEVSQNGNLESIDMLSGGEKVALAIALRLSLATYVMESIKTIVMDEPTTYLDEDRRSNLKDIIQYTFKGDETPVPQMVIVTHHKELGSVADNVFEISKKGGVSQISQG